MAFSKILEKKGKNVTLRQLSTTVSDTFYQTVTESYTDVQIKAIIPTITEGKDLLIEGYEVTGKIVAYTSTDVSVSEGDRLLVNGSEYGIERITRTDEYIKLEAVPL